MMPPSFPRPQIIQTPKLNSSAGNGPPYRNLNHGIDRFGSTAAPAGEIIQFPFQLQDTSVTGGSPVAQINVRYGTLQDVEPTNCATDIAIATGTTTFYIDLEVDIDGVFVAATLSSSLSGKPADTDYHGYITLGEADSPDGEIVSAIRQAATHSLRFSMCGRVVTDGVLITAGTYEFWGF